MDDDWIFLITLVGGGLGVSVLIGSLTIFIDAQSCRSQASAMKLEYSYGPLQDCMVQIDGSFIPLKSYKVIKMRPTQ